jgi:hypothetical protein
MEMLCCRRHAAPCRAPVTAPPTLGEYFPLPLSLTCKQAYKMLLLLIVQQLGFCAQFNVWASKRNYLVSEMVLQKLTLTQIVEILSFILGQPRQIDVKIMLYMYMDFGATHFISWPGHWLFWLATWLTHWHYHGFSQPLQAIMLPVTVEHAKFTFLGCHTIAVRN